MNNLFAWAEEYLKLIDKLWEAGDYEKGSEMLKSILQEEPGFSKAHYYEGWYAQYHLKDKKQARLHYEYAIHFDPLYCDIYINFSQLLVEELDEKRLRRLIKSTKDIKEVDKAELYNDLGRILEIKEKYVEASACFKEGLKYTTDAYSMSNIKNNRKRVRSKKRMFGAWYSKIIK
ncbi:MAG: tetratricopeptide (TPR) repeat protein [Patiriisocius sp.]|jgi:tetratricopeptide (TPR) repeat protein